MEKIKEKLMNLGLKLEQNELENCNLNHDFLSFMKAFLFGQSKISSQISPIWMFEL